MSGCSLAERTARAEAERANRLKDDFVAMVSHELRTPLNAILGWTDLMLKKRDDVALAARGLEIVARNTRLQTQLISDLLDISRIVSGKLRLDIQSVHLASVIEAAIETVEHAAEAKGIAIDRQLDTTIGPMAGDPARLQQVVWNLLSNALKFTPKGGRVRVVLRRSGPQAEIVDRGQRRRHPPRIPSACVRSFPTGGRLPSAAIRWSWTGTVHRPEPRQVSRRDRDC